jgi:hypothetical protein
MQTFNAYIGKKLPSWTKNIFSQLKSSSGLKTDTYLEHLGSNNNRLPNLVALGDHHLLSKENLTCGDLDTEITTGHHDTVGLVQDLIKVFDTLLVLNLDDDLNVGTLRAKYVTDILDILSTTDERGEDHVDAVLNTEAKIGLVLLRQSRKIDRGVGKVDTLVRGEGAVVDSADTHVGTVNGKDEEREDTWYNFVSDNIQS